MEVVTMKRSFSLDAHTLMQRAAVETGRRIKGAVGRQGMVGLLAAAVVAASLWAGVATRDRAPVHNATRSSAYALRTEAIITLPAQIQDHVRGTHSAHTRSTLPPSTAVPSEVLRTFPPQVQEQIQRATEAHIQKAGPNMLQPETIMALPPQIQAQVRAGHGTSSR
jgi:hypothetical protein